MTGTNQSGVEPMEYNLIVEAFEVEKKTAGGLILPDEHRDQLQFAQTKGRIVALSPLCFGFEEGAPRAEVGDTVIYAKHSGMYIDGADGKRYKVIKDKDVIGRVVA